MVSEKMSKWNIEIGDYVEIILGKKEFRGTLLQSPDDEKGVFLIKLDSGYNIGVSKKDVIDLRLLKKTEKAEKSDKGKDSNEKEEGKVEKNNQKPNIAMIITGGTISSSLDSKTGGVKWLTSPEKLFQFYPNMFKHINLYKLEVPFMKASESMDYKDWQKIAKVAVELLNDDNIKGLIITHGTDFLHYTSSALSFFLKDLNKPVVLTYSQRSSDRASSDASLNLECAALAAVSDIAEVMLVGHASTNDDFCYAMPGAKVRKFHASRRDAFKVVNGKPFAKVFTDRIEILSDFNMRRKGKVKLDNKFEEKIAIVRFYPGQDPDILDYYSKNKYKGLILEVSGLGHLPVGEARQSWIKKLNEVQRKGMIICATAQTIYGRLNPLVYSNGRELLKTGIIFLEDMLAETAFVKLGWVLAKTKKREEVKKLMLTNFAHELNDRLEE